MEYKNICVYGASSTAADAIYYESATELGSLLAQNGWGLVFGAGDRGVMGAVARGVHAAGGRVTGVLPAFMNVEGIPYKGCDELIVTQTMRERKQILEDSADGFIAAPGGIGTIEELVEIITLKQLMQHKKPIVILNIRGYYDHLAAMLEHCTQAKFMKKEGLSVYTVADTPEIAVDQLRRYVYTPLKDKWF